MRVYTRPSSAPRARLLQSLSASNVLTVGAATLAPSPIGTDVPPYLGNGYNMLKG
jgi:hypothetical protein